MIGQNNLSGKIKQLIENNDFPQFCILVGASGSGKKTFINDVIYPNLFNIGWSKYETDIKIDSIREMIKTAYFQFGMVYIISDADNMSIQAKNSLLKVTEEPPNGSIFIMTLQDENNTLETIKSRATIFHMDNYTPEEIRQYTQELMFNEYGIVKKLNHSAVENLIVELADTPGDAQLLWHSNILEFHSYVEKVIDNIAIVNGSNAFKIADRLQLKDDAEGYDLRLFFKIFIKICRDKIIQNKDISFEDFNKYTKAIRITSKYMTELNIKGILKAGIVDLWILDIRQEWM